MVKNLNSTSRLNIHYYPNRWYKSYITSFKAVIFGKSLISAGLDIDRSQCFVFHDKILPIYRQHWVRKFYQHILSKYRQISKKWFQKISKVLQPPSSSPTRHTLEFRVAKVIKRSGNRPNVKRKSLDNSFNSWIDKKDIA